MIRAFALILAAAAALAAESPEAGSWLRAIPGIGGGCCRALAVDAGGDDFRMVGQPQIVVGAEDDYLAAAFDVRSWAQWALNTVEALELTGIG